METSNLRDEAHFSTLGSVWEGDYRVTRDCLCVIEFDQECFEICSAAALGSSFYVICRAGSRNRGAYALIACINGPMPKICITRLRL